MKKAIEFCTCKDLQCPCHPSNHDQGCTLCILKNLKEKEIPSCFFNDIDCKKPTENWHYEDFAALVQAANQDAYDSEADDPFEYIHDPCLRFQR